MVERRRRLLVGLTFIVYFAVLFYFLFISERIGLSFYERGYHYNLIPFKEIRRFYTHVDVLGAKAVFINIFGNVAAFIPFGIFLPMFFVRCRRLPLTVFYSFELSLLIETLQLVTKLGTFDVDDIMLNTLGGLIGYAVYAMYMAASEVDLYAEETKQEKLQVHREETF
jgi:glycopeptide antibiotics resistance protein